MRSSSVFIWLLLPRFWFNMLCLCILQFLIIWNDLVFTTLGTYPNWWPFVFVPTAGVKIHYVWIQLWDALSQVKTLLHCIDCLWLTWTIDMYINIGELKGVTALTVSKAIRLCYFYKILKELKKTMPFKMQKRIPFWKTKCIKLLYSF